LEETGQDDQIRDEKLFHSRENILECEIAYEPNLLGGKPLEQRKVYL